MSFRTIHVNPWFSIPMKQTFQTPLLNRARSLLPPLMTRFSSEMNLPGASLGEVHLARFPQQYGLVEHPFWLSLKGEEHE